MTVRVTKAMNASILKKAGKSGNKQFDRPIKAGVQNLFLLHINKNLHLPVNQFKE
ncbi:hypothetical protein [Schleiferia thermophila]|uniref:hypothetical protein n=1 Tax=Schleiferia thermophila TaxID=884107 RepID=UPI003EEE8E2B